MGPWVRRFLVEHLVGERNLSRNTQKSYRDTLRLLLPFVVEQTRIPIDRMEVEAVSADVVRAFLTDLEGSRGCQISTRNQRLAAIRSLAGFIALHSPEHIHWCSTIRTIPFKRAPRPMVEYLERAEMDALLNSPDTASPQGRRDHAILLFCYNTGARADEVAHVRVGDLRLGLTPERDPSSVVIRGKGNKRRICPLWRQTVEELSPLVNGRQAEASVFLNRRGEPLTRFGVYAMVKRHAARAAMAHPSLAQKEVSPHTIRHSTAMHLLRAGVDINTIRAWLGHVSLRTTNVYAEADLEMKAKALSNCEIEADDVPRRPWREDADLMEFLRNL